MDRPLLSIACITYNHEKFISQALEGFLTQKTTFPYEIIIYNDASTDGATSILKGYKDRYPNIELILQNENQYSKGINPFAAIVFPKCRGKYIAVCEGDDYWIDPLKLQKQVDFLEAHQNFVACYHDATIVNENGKTIADSKIPEISKKDYSKDEMVKGKTFIPTLTLVFRNVLKNFPPEFNEVRNGDNFLTSLLGRHGSCKYIKEIQPAGYRRHSGGVWSSLSEEDKVFSKINTYGHMYRFYLRVGELNYAESYMNKVISLKDKLAHMVETKKNLIQNSGTKKGSRRGTNKSYLSPKSSQTIGEPLRIVCFKWFHPNGRYNNITVYGAQHVNNLARMIKKNLKIPHEFICITDNDQGIENDIRVIRIWEDLVSIGGRYPKLMAFSPDMKDIIGDRFAVLDLDAVITADMTPLFKREEDFVICRGTAPRTPYNSSMILMTAGKRSKVWNEFDKHNTPQFIKKTKLVGTDQAWISACLGPNEATWNPGDGVLSYHSHVKDEDKLPPNAKIVFFQGKYDPSHKDLQAKHPWILENWSNGRQVIQESTSSKVAAPHGNGQLSSIKLDNTDSTQIAPGSGMSTGKRKVFIDCGAYNGNSVRKFISTFSDFEIFSFEPNPIFNKYHKELPNKLFPVAVWTKDGTTGFYIDEYDFDGSSVFKHKLNIEGKTKLNVPCVDFSNWIKTEFSSRDFILLKMDIEGAEYAVLDKMIADGTVAYINELLIEFHWDKIGMKQESHEELLRQLRILGINPVKWDAYGWDSGTNSENDLLYLINRYPQYVVDENSKKKVVKDSTSIDQKYKETATPSLRQPFVICLLYDFEGWAWYHRAAAIQRFIKNPDFEIHIAPREEAHRYGDADLVVTFGPFGMLHLSTIPPSRRVIGSSNPFTVRHMEKILQQGLALAGIVNSLWQYQYLNSKENVYLLPNGVNTDLFVPSHKGFKEFSACWVGNARASNDKGLHLIQTAAAEAGVKVNVCDVNTAKGIAPILPHDQLRDRVYHQSAFYICMSNFEGTPNPALEALACGLPVISTPVGNMREIIKDGYNGYLIDRDVPSLTAAIRKLKNEDWVTMSRNARNSVLDGWKWSDQAKRYELAFSDLCAKRLKGSRLSAGRMRPADIEDQRAFLKQMDRILPYSRKNEKAAIEGEWIDNPPLKLTFVANDPDQLNGPNIWLQRILPELTKYGYRIKAIFLVPSIKPSRAADKLRRNGVECLFLRRHPTTEECVRELLFSLEEDPPDAFIPNTCVPAYYAARWAKAAGIPTIGIIRSDDTFHHELVEYFIEGEDAYRLSGVVCKSQFLEQYVRSHNPDGLPTLRSASGTWLPAKMASSPTDTLGIVYTGRLVQRQKRIFDVIHALKRVVNEVPGCRVRIYGDDREGGKAIKMIERQNLGEKLVYGGVLSLGKIYPTLQKNHVFVLLSDYEGMSTSLMEAMACGLVPICTRTRSGAEEIIIHNKNGLLVEDRGDAVVAAIRRLKEEDGLWKQLSTAARATIKARYTVSKGAERWNRFLKGLIRSTQFRRSIKPPELQEIDLPPLKDSENGLAREDFRLPKRQIEQQSAPDPFLNPPLSMENMDLYTVRSSILRALKEFVPRCKGTLLDVGCGQMPYRPLVQPNVDVYLGLDIINPEYQQSGAPDLIWDGVSMAIQANSVDCALATELFEHVPDPLLVLKEIKRVLKPGGELFFTVPFVWPLHDVPYDEYRYTPFSLSRHLQEAGFSNIDIKPLGGWNASLAQMIGLWITRSGLPQEVQDKYKEQLFPLYRTLIESDQSDFKFTSKSMFTGLYGTAVKPRMGESGQIRTGVIIPIEKQKRALRVTKRKPKVQNEPCLAIFTPCLGAISETFITNHIKYLAPERTVVVTGEIASSNWGKAPVLQIPFTNDPSRFEPDVAQKVLNFLQAHQVTHILSEYGCTGTEMVILNDQVTQLPIYVHFHGYDVSQELRKEKTVRYYHWMGEHVTGIITDTRLQKERLVDIGIADSNIHVIPYGVPIPDISAIPDTSPCRFVCVGRLVPKKAPLALLKAFALAHQAHPEITLDLVGAGPLMEDVQSFLSSSSLHSAVTLHGAIENRDVKKLMHQSSVYVQHSVTDPVSGDAEGLPVAILEAAAAGLPVVSTLHEGIPDEIEHGLTGYLVKEFDVEAMAAYMIKLAGDQELRKTMGAAARNKIQNGFTLEHEISALRNLMGLSNSPMGADVNRHQALMKSTGH